MKSKAIVDERTKNGPFKDADDLATRVKGLGTKSVANLEQNGLTIGGSSTPPTDKSSKPAMTKSTTANPMSTQGGSAAPNSTVKSSTAARRQPRPRHRRWLQRPRPAPKHRRRRARPRRPRQLPAPRVLRRQAMRSRRNPSAARRRTRPRAPPPRANKQS